MNLSSHLENSLSRKGFVYLENTRSYIKMERVKGKQKTILELYPLDSFLYDVYINQVSEGSYSEDEILSLV